MDSYDDGLIHNSWFSEGGFRTKSLSLSVANVIERLNNERLDIKPDFKSHYEWPISWSSKLIESALIGFPFQNIFCEETRYGELVILDGAQIINSFYKFSMNEFRLRGLTIRKDLNGASARDISYRDYNFLMDRFLLNFLVIPYDTHNVLKYEFCKRINIKNTRFSVQSARNYAFPKMAGYLTTMREELKHTIDFTLKAKYSRDIFKADSEVDQFFLFISLIVFLKFDIIVVDDEHISIGELLDQTAQILEQGRATDGLTEYVSSELIRLANCSEVFDFNITSTRESTIFYARGSFDS
ncbi:DUF262 domain-containing protein, partial [Serratia sarumanii]